MAKESDMNYGIQSIDVNGIVFAWDLDFDKVVKGLSDTIEKKKWPKNKNSRATPEKIPMRVFQMKKSRWTIAYPCDGLTEYALEFFNSDNILEMSYVEDTDMVCLELSDTSGIYNLWHCFIGQIKLLMSTDRRGFADNFLFNECKEVTVDKIDRYLSDKKIEYILTADSVPRDRKGVLPKFEDFFPFPEKIKSHALVI